MPRKNSGGELLRKDGQVWRRGDPPELLDWVANEGIRVSRLVDFISRAPVTPSALPLLRELLDSRPSAESFPPSPAPGPAPAPPEIAPGRVSITVPLHITISLGTATVGAGQLVSVNVSPASDEVELEKVEPDTSDPEYQHRPGYQHTFLGFDVPFPRLTNAIRSEAFTLPGPCGDDQFELRYHHFSVILNRDRMLAFVAGVNYHPAAAVQHPRDKDGDRWYFDPRVSAAGRFQAGEGLYAGNPLDRGHLVRRADAGWGATRKEAKLANDDTFHFTNCAPQHAITNQGQVKQAPPGLRLWGSLEDHVAAQGKKGKRKLNIFNGPVFRSTDEPYRGVQIPVEFWKVVVFENDAGDPAAAAFVLSQAALIADLEEEFEIGQYKTVQVKVKDLETKTHLDFGPLRAWDVLESDGAEEHFTRGAPAVVLESLSDVVL